MDNKWQDIGFTDDFSWSGPAWSIGNEGDFKTTTWKAPGDSYNVYMKSPPKLINPPPVSFIWSIDYKMDTTQLTVRWFWNGEQMTLVLAVANNFEEMSKIDKFEWMLKDHLQNTPYEALVLSEWKKLDSSFVKNQPKKAAHLHLVSDPAFEKPKPSVSAQLSRAANDLPGIREKVKFPCGGHTHCIDAHNDEMTLMSAIMILNDSCKWTREEIADWIETLDVDTTFKTPTKENDNE